MIYALGEGANSLVMNGVLAFALIYYTKALGMSPFWAGVAMSVSMFWEAVSEPLMGHISDNTRSRWGRRHPHMVLGGVLMAVGCYLICAVPDVFRGSPGLTFGYLVSINLILRTGLTMFFIPYMALGFEMCSDYRGRSRLQAARVIFNMIINFAGPAMAWTVFFRDEGGIPGTSVASNYRDMGAVFGLGTAAFVLATVAGTSSHMEDTRHAPALSGTGWMRDFLRDLSRILVDPNARWVVAFVLVASVGTMWVGSLQMFVYDDFMRFPAHEKTLAHGSSMVGMALGAFLSMGIAGRLDKKGAVLLGCVASAAANGILILVFVSGLVPVGATCNVGGHGIPVTLLLFVVFHAGYWMGIGIVMPVSTAMMADVAEIHRLETGVGRDGGYSSVYSLAMRLAWAIGLMASGAGLHLIGYLVPQGAEPAAQGTSVAWRLGLATFLGGTVACLLALETIRRHPVTWRCLEELRARRQRDQEGSPDPAGSSLEAARALRNRDL